MRSSKQTAAILALNQKTENEKNKIAQELQKKKSTLEIAEMLGRDHRTIKKYATNPQSCMGEQIREKFEKIQVCLVG